MIKLNLKILAFPLKLMTEDAFAIFSLRYKNWLYFLNSTIAIKAKILTVLLIIQKIKAF